MTPRIQAQLSWQLEVVRNEGREFGRGQRAGGGGDNGRFNVSDGIWFMPPSCLKMRS